MKINRDKNRKFSDVIKFVSSYVREKYKEPIINKETKFPIELNPSGVKHSLAYNYFKNNKFRQTELTSVVRKLGQIIKDAQLVNIKTDYKDRDDILRVYFFRYEDIEIIVRETIINKPKKINKYLFYNHRFIVDEIKKPD